MRPTAHSHETQHSVTLTHSPWPDPPLASHSRLPRIAQSPATDHHLRRLPLLFVRTSFLPLLFLSTFLCSSRLPLPLESRPSSDFVRPSRLHPPQSQWARSWVRHCPRRSRQHRSIRSTISCIPLVHCHLSFTPGYHIHLFTRICSHPMDDNDNWEEEEEELEFSRNYFLAKELASSVKKSKHKLTDINIVDEKELREAALHIQPKHENEIALLMDSYTAMYPDWLLSLRCGFALLMYGFGSKKALIEDFASTALTEYSVVVINGYLQAINLKQVVIALAELLCDQVKAKRRVSCRDLPKSQQPFNSQSMEDLLTFLDEVEVEDSNCFVCVIIHNIDGPGLRDSETQQYLARLAACTHIRIIASIDHVNAPLFWDKNMAHTQFNWCWYHVPTFAPYKVEGMFYPLILAHGSASQSVKTAAIVLQSLTPNARSVFKVLAEYQLSHPEEGMPKSDLYSVCRERFLVGSQITLKSHLTEFEDHELVKTKRNSNGQDCLHIPLATEAIQKVLLEIS